MGSLPPSGGNAPLGTIVVVGGSLAGLRAVETLRRLGFEGRIHLVGAERHLPYDRPPLSKQVLAGTWEPDRVWLKEEHALAGLEVETHLGRTATDLDLDERVVLLHGGTRLGFDGLLVATGATPRHLPDTADLDGVHVLRTLEDCLSLRRAFDDGPRVAVVGAHAGSGGDRPGSATCAAGVGTGPGDGQGVRGAPPRSWCRPAV